MKLWPSRSKASKNLEPVADLDAIVADPVPFRYKGKIHVLKPLSLEEFLKFTNAQNTLLSSIGDSTETPMTARDLAERYHKVIASVCDSVTVDDIMTMEQAQVAALYQLVIDLVTGQVDVGGGTSKKKRQKIHLYESVQALSSPSAPESSDGQSSKH